MMFESSSKNRKSWDGRQMIRQCIPDARSNRWEWFGGGHGGFTCGDTYWQRWRRAECSRRYISRDERSKIGWLLKSHPISPPLFHGMCQHNHFDLPFPWQFVSLHKKPQWQCPNHFHSLLQISGINSYVILHPFHSALPAFKERLTYHLFSSTFPPMYVLNHPLTSCFVMSTHPQM